MPTFALNFSRPGGQVVAQYYTLLRYGHEGFTKIYQASAEAARALGGRIAAIDSLRLLYDGTGGLPAVAWTLAEPASSRDSDRDSNSDPASAGFTLYQLADRLRNRGWQVPAYPLPARRDGTVIQRALIRHGVGYDKVMLLARDIESAVKELTAGTPHRVPKIGFHH